MSQATPQRSTPTPTEKHLHDVELHLQSALYANEVATWAWGILNDRVIVPEAFGQILSMGTGVGLRGIRECIRPFSGRVNIESQEGVGTTALVTLPLNGRG
jgi:sensor histidine kinase regulating citrate/malate metabolism